MKTDAYVNVSLERLTELILSMRNGVAKRRKQAFEDAVKAAMKPRRLRSWLRGSNVVRTREEAEAFVVSKADHADGFDFIYWREHGWSVLEFAEKMELAVQTETTDTMLLSVDTLDYIHGWASKE